MYEIEYANFNGGFFRKFWFKRNALKEYGRTKHSAFRVTLKRGKKQLVTQVNENLRPEYYK